MSYNPQDHYFKKAKAEDFVARSVYKLQEIHSKYKIFKKGDYVLDLGAAPGSWSQYAASIVDKTGLVIGIDITPISMDIPNAEFIKGDIYDLDLEIYFEKLDLEKPFAAVISDMAPKTTGIKITDQARSFDLCAQALIIAKKFLGPKGNFVCKLFESEQSIEFRNRMRNTFEKVHILRPASTRKQSTEVFFIGLSLKNN